VSRIAAVVLAAGAATRFGAPKQRLLLPDVLARLEKSPVDEIVVVEGAYRLCGESPQSRARLVPCAEWEKGPGASLRTGRGSRRRP
jgi:CTP:molybdopterin cytidylyltransferase MocA